jgi:hypothetical protein
MPDLRYMGKHHWTQTVLKEDGSFKGFNIVAPGETISVDEQVAERFLQGPRDGRLFVASGSSEDPNSADYQRSKWDDGITVGNYVSQDHLREFGSTSPEGRVVFRTEDDNEENFPVAPPEVGPQSDNAALYEEDEIRAEADKARDKARESRSAKRPDSSAGTPSSAPPGRVGGSAPRSDRTRPAE